MYVCVSVFRGFKHDGYDDLTTGQSDRHWRAHTERCHVTRAASARKNPPHHHHRERRAFSTACRVAPARAHAAAAAASRDLPFSSPVRFYRAVREKRVAPRHRRRAAEPRAEGPIKTESARAARANDRRRRRGGGAAGPIAVQFVMAGARGAQWRPVDPPPPPPRFGLSSGRLIRAPTSTGPVTN